jgi:GalNAc-alpha-(1->4)-GalNAc-alpha-(1->3)-diNAcBac-PP-undecaprenol alpha-1,4-N-acetyl-D-galactosaminyltransferase
MPPALCLSILMRITTVIEGLSGGGAERVCVNLANAWAARGWDVTILTVSDRRAPAYAIDSRVRRRHIGWKRGADPKELNANSIAPMLRGLHGVACFEIIWEMPLLAMLRYAILATTPNVVVAFLDFTNVKVLAAMHETGIPVIACEQTDVSKFSIGEWQDTREALYRRASAVVAPDPAIAEWLRRHGARAYAIPNPLNAPPSIRVERTSGPRRLVTLMRLSQEKRPDLLVNAFAGIAGDFTEWDLEIYGVGPMREDLAELVDELAPGRITLRGFTDTPYEVLSSADLFVSASWIEGFGNAIWEALACGVPVVAMECGAAVRSLVRDGIDGLIVDSDSPEALASALTSLMGNDTARRAMAARAPEVLTRFSIESALEKWDALLGEVATR